MKKKLLVALAVLLVSTFQTAVHAQNSAEVTTFIKAYANFIPGGQANIAPEDLQATSDGGYLFLSSSDGPDGLASWLLKTDALGNQQWSEEVADFSPSGGYSIGASLQQTRDGGYVLAGGQDLGYGQSALVEKLNSSGSVQWSSTYTGGASVLSQIRQTRDGGYIAVGGTSHGEGIYGALILRLGSNGTVLWQKVLGPQGQTLAAFTQVVQTADGGFAALGYTYVPRGGLGLEAVFVAKYTAVGALQWQNTFNEPNGHQAPFALGQTSDGGYVVGGATSLTTGDQAYGLLLKLDSRGNLQWQKSYASALGGFVVYSVHQSSDGGYVLAGESTSPACNGVVPWMTKVDSSGNVVWEHLYYETIDGCPKSEYFASSILTADGGILATGWTEEPQTRIGELFVVKTDSNGLCSSGCPEIYDVPAPTATRTSLRPMLVALPVNNHLTPALPSPAQSQATTVVERQDCD